MKRERLSTRLLVARESIESKKRNHHRDCGNKPCKRSFNMIANRSVFSLTVDLTLPGILADNFFIFYLLSYS